MREMTCQAGQKRIVATLVLVLAVLGFFLLDEVYILIVDAWHWIPFYVCALW